MGESFAAGLDPAASSLELRADCGRCFSLCCVVPAITRSADFAIDKPAGQPCPNLTQTGFDCSIHDRLRKNGFGGCAAYDCFGAGQHVAQGTFGGRDWRQAPELAAPMFAAFGVMRALHELAWYLRSALELQLDEPLAAELTKALELTARPTSLGPVELAATERRSPARPGQSAAAARQRTRPVPNRAARPRPARR